MTYTGSATDEDHFRRHALVEKKLRALALPYAVDEWIFAQFRKSAISSRLAETYQRQLFEGVRRSCKSIPPDALQMLPSEPAAFVARLKGDCARLEMALDEQIEHARQIFTQVAGPIGPPAAESRYEATPLAEATGGVFNVAW